MASFTSLFTPMEVAEIRRLFNKIDSDGSGKLDLSEVHALMTDMGEDVTQAKVATMIAEVMYCTCRFHRG